MQQGVITEAQLDDAVRYQREMNKRLGEVALDRGVLTAEQVASICNRQREDARMFGSIALNEKHLSKKTLDELLFIQKIHYIYLGEALLLRGHITSKQYASLLRDYYQLEGDKKLNLKYVQEFFAEHKALASMIEAFSRAYSRFLGGAVKVSVIGCEIDPEAYKTIKLIRGNVSGDRDFNCFFFLSSGVDEHIRGACPPSRPDGDAPAPLENLFQVVLNYFNMLLRERGLFAAKAILEQDKSRPQPNEGDAAVCLAAPAGNIALTFNCAETRP